MNDNLYAVLFERVQSDLDRPFLLLPDGSSISYRQAHARTGQIAGFFQKSGVRQGDRIAVQAAKSPELLLVYLAAVRAGAIYLPLNTAYTPHELEYFLQDAAPSIFICDPSFEETAKTLCASAGVQQVETLDARGEGSLPRQAGTMPEGFETALMQADDLAAILYTSGTTGRSKGAMLTHRNLASNAETLRSLWRFTAEDRLLHALPIFHTHGLFVATNVVLLSGSAMIFLSSFDLDAIIRLMPSASVFMGVPTYYSRLLGRDDFTHELAKGMRLFVSGSAPLSAETHREFSARTGHEILERYGMTETNMNSSNPYEGLRLPGSVGMPLPDVEIRITDPESDTVLSDPEEVGMIEVRGPNVFKGYWRMPEKTAEEIRPDGFFITGDLGRFDERGYLFISGRGKDLIISGGFNVYPAEVEALLDEIEGVAESAVIGAPHPDLSEGVVAVIAVRPGFELDEETVKGALAGKLAGYKRPKRVLMVPELPRNAMGKVQKAELRQTYKQIFAA